MKTEAEVKRAIELLANAAAQTANIIEVTAITTVVAALQWVVNGDRLVGDLIDGLEKDAPGGATDA